MIRTEQFFYDELDTGCTDTVHLREPDLTDVEEDGGYGFRARVY